jgi:hypothetical protein
MTSKKEQILKSIEAKIDQITKLTEEIMTDIWNGAIEEEAEYSEKELHSLFAGEAIRKLKK